MSIQLYVWWVGRLVSKWAGRWEGRQTVGGRQDGRVIRQAGGQAVNLEHLTIWKICLLLSAPLSACDVLPCNLQNKI